MIDAETMASLIFGRDLDRNTLDEVKQANPLLAARMVWVAGLSSGRLAKLENARIEHPADTATLDVRGTSPQGNVTNWRVVLRPFASDWRVVDFGDSSGSCLLRFIDSCTPVCAIVLHQCSLLFCRGWEKT